MSTRPIRFIPFSLVFGFMVGVARLCNASGNEDLAFFAQEANIVHAAAKHAQPVLSAPAAAQVITAQDIQRYGYRTIAEALQSVPGFYISDDRNYTHIGIRGFGRPGDFNSRILMLVNGHRMNENVYGGLYPGNEFGVDLDAIEQIEVIKGPGSALYGDSAFLAVVNLVTKSPKGADRVQADLSGGSYGTAKGFGAVAKSWQDGANGVYASGAVRHMDGQNLNFPEFQSINNGTAFHADREDNYDAYAQLAQGNFLFQGNFGSRTKKIPTASFGTQFNDNRTQTTDARGFLEAQLRHELNSWIQWFGRLYYDRYDYRGDFANINESAPPDTILNKDSARADWYGEETRLELTPWGKLNTLTLGQEFEKNLEIHQLNYDADPYQPILDTTHRPQRWAMFLQQELSPLSPLAITLGGRLDHYDSFGNTFNPRSAIVYTPRKETALKFLYGSAFRAPNAFELYFADSSTSKGNPNLLPEKIQSLEFQWAEQLNRSANVSMGYFHNVIHDLITQVTDPSDGLLQFQNKEKIISDGMELAVKAQLTSTLSGHGGYVLQQTQESGGGLLPNSPAMLGTLGLSQMFDHRYSVSLDAYAQGSRRTIQNTTLPPFVTLNTLISLEPWKAGPRIYAGVYNVFDRMYSQSGGPEHVQDAIGQNGRNFTLGLEIRFGRQGHSN